MNRRTETARLIRKERLGELLAKPVLNSAELSRAIGLKHSLRWEDFRISEHKQEDLERVLRELALEILDIVGPNNKGETG